MPESIRYLALQTKMSDIQQIRANLRCDHNNIENDLAIWTEHKNQFRAAFKGNITYVVPVFGLYICKQMTGVVPVLFYFQTIFELIGKSWFTNLSSGRHICLQSYIFFLVRPNEAHNGVKSQCLRTQTVDSYGAYGVKEQYLIWQCLPSRMFLHWMRHSVHF